MLYAGTDPESRITEYTLVYEDTVTECGTQGDELTEVFRILLKTMRCNCQNRVLFPPQIKSSHHSLQGDQPKEVPRILLKTTRYNGENRVSPLQINPLHLVFAG